MVNATKKAGLGNTISRASKVMGRMRNPRKSKLHTTDTLPDQDNARLNLRSCTAQTNLDEFFEEAELAGKQFVTERRNMTLINEKDNTQVDLYAEHEKQAKAELEDDDFTNCLSVPRRPKWDSSTTPEQLDEMERHTFLKWRRRLARVQESDGVYMTPFEKNIEVWRQLWRVIERSDIIVQILDCRNPLLFLCEDLIKYVEVDSHKMNLVLLNKADFLTSEQRRFWLQYFKSKHIKTIFFSALIENLNAKAGDQDKDGSLQNSSSTYNQDSSSEDDQDDEVQVHIDEEKVTQQMKENLNIKDGEPSNEDEIKVYNKFELLDAWRDILIQARAKRLKETNGTTNSKHPAPEEAYGSASNNGSADSKIDMLTVGLVGYPNVGKSSTINALLAAKRVAVSATPGKTKHFQTFLVDKDMMLCDCPGLVFPNFVSNKAEMVINGILPIDQMHDYVGPVRLIVNRIPKAFFEDLYGLAFEQDEKQNLCAEDLLNALGFMRGYMTARGLPDISRASRKVCKDYINGKILYCEAPPNFDKSLYLSHSKMADAMKRIAAKDPAMALKITERQRRLMAQAKGTDITNGEFNALFFKSQSMGFHVKGLPNIGNMVRPIGDCQEKFCTKQAPTREKKHKKREKLRRVYRHMDI